MKMTAFKIPVVKNASQQNSRNQNQSMGDRDRILHLPQVHPLVVQSYKTAVCFVTCWLTLLVVPLRFTWWGTLGALIWVRAPRFACCPGVHTDVKTDPTF